MRFENTFEKIFFPQNHERERFERLLIFVTNLSLTGTKSYLKVFFAENYLFNNLPSKF